MIQPAVKPCLGSGKDHHPVKVQAALDCLSTNLPYLDLPCCTFTSGTSGGQAEAGSCFNCTSATFWSNIPSGTEHPLWRTSPVGLQSHVMGSRRHAADRGIRVPHASRKPLFACKLISTVRQGKGADNSSLRVMVATLRACEIDTIPNLQPGREREQERKSQRERGSRLIVQVR